jgi:signal transduction histidine kinase
MTSRTLQEQLHSVIRDLGTTSNFEQALDLILYSAAKLTHSQAASILEYNQATNRLRFLVSSLPHAEKLETISIPLDVSAASWTFRNNQTLILSDVQNDPRHYPVIDQTIGFNTNTALTVPLPYMGNTLGVIEVVNKTNSAHYTEEDGTILETLGVYCGALLWTSMFEQRIQSTREEIAELDRLKSNFIAITSHELRTPLGLILGHATFLREVTEESNREQVDIIIQSVSRLKDIVDSLTNIDNYETGMATIRNKAVSLNLIIEEVAASFQDMAISKDITIELDLGNKNLFIEADANKITIALSNLLRNAITFSSDGSRVKILMETIQGHARVSVMDHGIGIPAQDLPKIFDRFYQVESHLTRRYSGMGLGLSVAKSMIELHGGRIWVESEEGKGSNFIFTIPVRPEIKQNKVSALTT